MSHDPHQMMEEHSSSGKLEHIEEIIVILKGVLYNVQRKERIIAYNYYGGVNICRYT